MAVLALLLLAGYVVRALRKRPEARAVGRDIGPALVRWSTREAPGRAHVVFDSAPSPELRDWLAALGDAGTKTTWGGAAPAPGAVAVEPVADPRYPSRVWVAAASGTGVMLRDRLGLLDSTMVTRGGAQLLVPNLEGTLSATIGAGTRETRATAVLHDSLLLRPVLVLGIASWEAKFLLAALEEHGWKVDARLAVAPSGDAWQGAAGVVLDTARYAAVIALDSVAVRYAGQIRRYVRAGGGLIVAADAARLAAFRLLLPATAAPVPTVPRKFTAVDTADPRAALSLLPLSRLKTGALALERRGNQVAVAAWRVGDGRVIQLGYLDTWRWRMAGAAADPVRAHRVWWARVVSSVAYAPQRPRLVTELAEPTPLASLLMTLGSPTPPPPKLAGVLDDPRLAPLLFGVFLAAMFLEWASRRLRGVR